MCFAKDDDWLPNSSSNGAREESHTAVEASHSLGSALFLASHFTFLEPTGGTWTTAGEDIGKFRGAAGLRLVRRFRAPAREGRGGLAGCRGEKLVT